MKINIKKSYACDFETLVLTKEQIEERMYGHGGVAKYTIMIIMTW